MTDVQKSRYRKLGDRIRSSVAFVKPSLTKQSFKDECDISNIMSKYQKTGLITHVKRHGGNYSDLSDVVDYHDAMNRIIKAQDAFNSLPSSIRAKFNNDPGQFVEFVSNPKNEKEMIELGLATAKPEIASTTYANPSPAGNEAKKSKKSAASEAGSSDAA